MKYLIPLFFLLALPGCENNSNSSGDRGATTSGKNLDYLDQPLKGRVGQHGLYKLIRSGGVVEDPSTSTGKAVAKPVVQQVESTERIPLIRGAQMYLQYRIWYLPDRPAYVDLRQVLKHPEMTLPDGSVSTGSDFMIKGKVSVNQAIGFIGYGFDEDYELVEGDWVFEIWYQGKKMINQKFTTYWPDKEEIADLESKLAPTTSVGVMNSSGKKPPSGYDWPRVQLNIGEDPPPAPTD